MEQKGREYITPEIDKRRHRRATLITQVRCETMGRQELLLTRDVSVGGVFISTKDPFPSGSEVALSFRVSSSNAPVSCQGIVVYSIRGLGMGVQFFDMSEETRQALQNFVDETA